MTTSSIVTISSMVSLVYDSIIGPIHNLDSGLDYGLDCELNYGLDAWMLSTLLVSSMSNLTIIGCNRPC